MAAMTVEKGLLDVANLVCIQKFDDAGVVSPANRQFALMLAEKSKHGGMVSLGGLTSVEERLGVGWCVSCPLKGSRILALQSHVQLAQNHVVCGSVRYGVRQRDL
jgi:hypothetical protein